MKPTVFISHISEEAEVAIWLKDSISNLLLEGVTFFVSSDRTAIIGGDRWLTKIEEALRTAPIVLVLCSPQSVYRPWVNFEAGGAWIAGKRVIPVCHAGMQPSNLPEPLKTLQAYDLTLEQDFYDIVALLASAAELRMPDFDLADTLSGIPTISKIQQVIPPSAQQASDRPDSETTDSHADIKIGFKNRDNKSGIHRYSLTLSVTWQAPRYQDFFNITLMWPKDVRISNLIGFERRKEEKIDEIIYEELSLFVDKRLWPQKNIKVVGSKAAAKLEYDFDDVTYQKVHSKLSQEHYKLNYIFSSQNFPSLKGTVSFKELNNY